MSTMQKMKVFVHLSTGQDAATWKKSWDEGKLIGFNDPSPYGYARANALGCDITFSKVKPENAIQKYFRFFLRLCLGFDFIHALNNKAEIYQSDIVWTHTETQFLGVALLFALNPKLKRPKIIAQSVWLFDRWNQFSFIKRSFFSKLVTYVDILTVHSQENLAFAKQLWPSSRIEYVQYGVPSENCYPVIERAIKPIRVLALGNDKDRDWQTLIQALGNRSTIELTIVTTKLKPSDYQHYKNVQITSLHSQEELIDHFNQASLMVIPLKPNMHASGITVMQESALMGVPMIVSDTGGLKDYFDESCVHYIPPQDASAITQAVEAFSKDSSKMMQLAQRAQDRMQSGHIDCQAYIQKHVDISRVILSD